MSVGVGHAIYLSAMLCQVVAGVSFPGMVRVLLVKRFYTEPGGDVFLAFHWFQPVQYTTKSKDLSSHKLAALEF